MLLMLNGFSFSSDVDRWLVLHAIILDSLLPNPQSQNRGSPAETTGLLIDWPTTTPRQRRR